jgi:superfamily II DNA helicase RecQ
MDLGRLIRFIKEREMTVEDVKRFVARLRANAGGDELTIGHGELGERDRVLLSVAERAGAVQLSPAGRDGLLVRLTGQGSPRMAQTAIAAARNRGWEAYRSIERYSSDGETCRRRQILDHFGDSAAGASTGRCCDVCDADTELERVLREAPTSARRTRGARGAGSTTGGDAAARRERAAAAAAAEDALDPVDEREFDELRAWRLARAEGKPAFTVAADSVLRALLRERPGSTAELLEIKGIGPAFCEKHAESLLETLAAL